MRFLRTIFVYSLALAVSITAYGDVAAQYVIQVGGDIGSGDLHGVPFIWESTAPIDKTFDAALLRVNDFTGERVTYTFEKPVVVNALVLMNVNVSSKSHISIFDSAGDLIRLDNVKISSPDVDIGSFPSTLANDGSLNFAAAKGGTNYLVNIEFLDSISDVKVIVFEIESEAGLLGIRIRGQR